jgi:hypothetical protein
MEFFKILWRIKSMKKIFIALSVLAALTLGVGSALAVPGAVDNVPGTDFTAPFLVSDARVTQGSGPTTLLDLSEVRGFATDFHFFFYDTHSNYIADAWVDITHWGTIMRDVAVLLQSMSPTDRARLQITFDGETYYAGYIEAENNIWVPVLPGSSTLVRQRGTLDNVIGSLYFLNLSGGQAAASNLPMREYYTAGLPALAQLIIPNNGGAGTAVSPFIMTPTAAQLARWAITGTSYAPWWAGGVAYVPATKFGNLNNCENWSPVAMAAAANLTWGNAVTTTNYATFNATGAVLTSWTAPDVNWFRLIPEYYILDATGRTIFVFWQNGMPNGTTFHMYVINDDEDYYSTTIPLDEVTFIDAIDWIPSGLLVSYPYSGIFNWTMRDTSLNATPFVWKYAEMLGWNWQSANNGAASAATNWQILKEMARDVGTVPGTIPVPNHIF